MFRRSVSLLKNKVLSQSSKNAVLARLGDIGFSESQKEDCYFPREYTGSKLGFLRASAVRDDNYLEEVDPEYFETERADEVKADAKQGVARWNALQTGLKNADAVTELFKFKKAGDIIENYHFFFGYGDPGTFAFSIPPSVPKGKAWDLNQVLVASHYNDVITAAKKKSCVEPHQIFDNEAARMLEIGSGGIETLVEKLIEEMEDEEDEATKKKMKKSLQEWHTAMKALPFYKQLLWAEGANNNCAATVFFAYRQDVVNRVVWGTWVYRRW